VASLIGKSSVNSLSLTTDLNEVRGPGSTEILPRISSYHLTKSPPKLGSCTQTAERLATDPEQQFQRDLLITNSTQPEAALSLLASFRCNMCKTRGIVAAAALMTDPEYHPETPSITDATLARPLKHANIKHANSCFL
jgi:hypothetical protein